MGQRSIVFLTSYPPKGETHARETVGVASYSKQLVESWVETDPVLNVRVIGEKLKGEKNYSEKRVSVERVWQRGSLRSLIKMFRRVGRMEERVIVAAFEINMFGGYVHAVFALIALIWLRLIGKQIVLILHQVPASNTDIGFEGFLFLLQRIMIRFFYVLVKMAGSKIVVFEKYLANVLGDGKNIEVIPHFLPTIKKVEIQESRARLKWDSSKKYIVVFGYIAPYKGILRLVKNWEGERDIRLVIAGGINPNHLRNKKICAYVDKVKTEAQKKGIVVTGFVEECMIQDYFVGCDAMVFPYKAMFASSGPLAWGMAYGKPLLLSRELRPYLESKDIRAALKESGLYINDVFVDFNKSNYMDRIKTVMSEKDKWEKFGKKMVENRAIAKIAEKYERLYVNILGNHG